MRKLFVLLCRPKSFQLFGLSLITVFFSSTCAAQDNLEKGLPFITNYTPKMFKALPQAWSVQEDNRGVMYFGIQNYILEYDGVKWRKINLRSSATAVVRSMAMDTDGIIYYGSFGDLGYLAKDSLGQVVAYSLLNEIPANSRDFLDIWSTYNTPDGIYFQSRQYIFRLKKNGSSGHYNVKVWKPQSRFMYAFYLDGAYYVHQQGLGLYRMTNESLVLIPGSEFLGKERTQIMLPYPAGPNGEKQYLIGMFYSGLYIYDGKTFRPFGTKADAIIKSGVLLYKGIQLANGNYVLSSTGNGLVIIDPQGNLLQRINRSVGLQDESIYAAYIDKKGALWLALDNGISRVEISSPLTQFTLQSGISTSVLSVARFEGDLYVGTTNGLLRYNKSRQFFEIVPGIAQNQIFSLLVNKDELLVSGDGLFAIRNGKAYTIRRSMSADLTLNSLHVSVSDPGTLLGGGSFGAAVFKKKSPLAEWNFAGFIPGIDGQIWSFAENKNGTYWAGTQTGSDYLVDLVFDNDGNVDTTKTKVTKYGADQGFVNGLGTVVTIQGTNYFAADSSFYTFDLSKKRFIPDATFGTFSQGGASSEQAVVEGPDGKVWIRIGKESRVASPKPGGGYTLNRPNLNAINELTIQSFYPENTGILWVCTSDGLVRDDQNLEKSHDESFNTILTHIEAGKSALATATNKKSLSISHNDNTLRFEYAAPFFEQEDKTQYQTWLEGFESSWSDLDNNYYKEYTNLSPGKYTFHVRAVNIYHKQSTEAVYRFEILPPWYATWWAYTLYALAVAGLIYIIVRWRTRQLHEKHKALEKLVAERTKELSHRVEELAVINSVQEGLVREIDMQGIYNLVGEKLREIFNAQVIDIATYDNNTKLLTDHYSYEKGDRTLIGSWEPKGFRKHVIETKQLMCINRDLEKISLEYGTPVIAGEMPKAVVFVPMVSGNQVKGMISLQNLDKENVFSDSAVNLLTTLANSMSVALESAHRFDETTRLLKETEQRNAELAVINSVQESLVAQMNMDAIYELVGEKMREIFNPQVIDIVTYDSRANLIEDKYAWEKGDRTLVGTRPPNGFRKHVLETGQLLLHNSGVEAAMKQFGNEILFGEVPKSQIYVPMIAAGKVTGVISLQNIDHENAFSESDVKLLVTLANSMSVALESARLFDETNRLLKETEQRNAELAIINSVQEGLASKLDMQGIYDLVGNKIQSIFDAQVVDIVTYNQKTNLIYPRYVIERGERFYEEPRPLIGFRKHVVETKQYFLINKDNEKLAAQFGNPLVVQGEAPKSVLFVPMMVGREVKGIISLQNLDHENAFTEGDVRLLTTLSNSMSVALENARLFDETNRLLKETEQRNAELAVINSVQESLVAQLDMDSIYELVGEKIREIFQAQVVDIVTYDRARNVIEDKYSYEKGDRSIIGAREPKGFRKYVIEKGEVLLHNENVEQAMRDFDNQVIIGEMPKSQIYVPMFAAGEVKGVISLQNLDHEHAFSDSDVSLLTTLSNSMSVALESARLFDETNRLLKETEQRTAELAVINSVQVGLAKELDMQGIYDLVGSKIRDLFDAQAVIVATLEQETGLEHFKYVIEEGKRYYPDSRPYDKLRDHLIQTRQKMVINTNYADAYERFGLKTVPGTKMTKSGVFFPLFIGDKVNSYISLQNMDRENAFSEADVRLLETLSNSMSVALENARLFDETNRLLKETEQRTAELAVINSVQDGLAKELDMQGIYDLVGERVQKLFKAQVVLIASFDHDKKLEYFNYAIEKGERSYPGSRPFDKVRQYLIDTGQNILINENFPKAAAEFGMKVIPGTEVPKSLLFMPLKVGDKVNGYVSLQNVDQENAFSFSDVRLLGTLANSMSVALENARLFDETTRLLKETEQRTAELAVINSVQEGLARELDIQGIYDLVGDRIRNLFDAQVVGIATLNLDAETEHFNYVFEKGNRYYPRPRRYDKLRQHLVKTRQKIVINRDVVDAFNKFGMAAVSGTELPKSMLFVPLIIGDKITSYVTLQNIDRENAFSESDVRLLETLANSMSVALENARLFDETNRLLKETEQRTAELGIINSVQQGLASKLDIQSIYDLVGEKMRELFSAQVIDIVTYDKSTNLIEDQYTFEKGDRTLLGPRPLKGFRKHVVDTAKPLVINENLDEQRSKYDQLVMIGEGAKSIVLVPMIASGEVTGVISLQNLDEENAFSPSDVNLLTTLASSMSVALESAKRFDETKRLLKETEQRTAELAVINSVQEGLAHELDMQGVYDLVGDRIQRLFKAQVVIIATFDHENKLEYFNYAFENGKNFTFEPRPIGHLRQILIERKSRIYIETERQAREEYGITAIEGTKMPKCLLFVPLLSGSEIKGYVSLQNVDSDRAFSQSDIRLLETLANSMSVALENARLFDETNRLLQETEQRTSELAVINSIQEGLVREMNIQGIYKLVGDRLCAIFPETQTLVIRTFDQDAGLEHFHYTMENGEQLTVAPQPFIWESKELIATKRFLAIQENYEAIAAQHGESAVTEGLPVKSAIFVPMIAGDLVKGSISLQNAEREHAFSESNIRLLTTLTNSMSVALENARLFDETNRLLKETEQRQAELSVINNVQEGLVREMNMQAIYELVGNRICDLFDTQTVIIRTFDQKTETELWQYAIERGQRLYSRPRPFIWANRQLIETKQPLLINENYFETAKKFGGAGVTKGLPPKSAIFVPMIVGDVVRGSISLQNVEKENAFSETDVRLLTTLTNSMSVAIENARLFDETSHLLAEAKQRATELSTVNSISKALASQLNPDELIKLVGDQLKDLFRANIVYLALLNKQTNMIYFPYQHGDNNKPMRLGEGLTSKIILTGTPLLINKDVTQEYSKLGLKRQGTPAASYLGVPIPVGDDIVGVLSVQSTEQENRFDENDMRLLSTIGSSVGVALKNAQLFEDVKQAKMEAEEATKTAEKANEAKSAFLSTVSHELRTPLTSVLGFAKIIKKRLDERIFPVTDKSDAKTTKTIQQISENLNVVVSEGERLTHLINDVLDLAKIEAGKMEWNVETVSMVEVTERAIAATAALFDNNNLTLEKDIQPDIPVISGDRDKLIQVMVNLISNSVKFTPKGKVSISVAKKKGDIIVSVADTGIGIAPKDHAAVFEQFKQVGDTLTDKPKGTGLGLPICKEIVEHHGGKIWLESDLGKGSTFFFSLPLVKSSNGRPLHLDDLVRQLKEQVEQSQYNLHGKAGSILIVDDDDSIRSLLQQELGDAGYIIDEARDGREALEHVRNNKPDLIILDIMMPEMNGFDVAAVLKNDPQTMDIPIIVLSVVQDKARGFKIGVDRYLTKPIDTGVLFSEIGSLLEQGKSKKKVMIVDEDSATVSTLTEVLKTKGYAVMESTGKELVEKAIAAQPDIIIMNSILPGKQDIVQTLRFEKGLENVLFLVYQ